MKRTLLRTSLLALLACCSVSMGASAMVGDEDEDLSVSMGAFTRLEAENDKAEEPSPRQSRFIRAINVSPLLDDIKVETDFLRRALIARIRAEVQQKYGPDAATQMEEEYTSGTRKITYEDLLKSGAKVDRESLQLNVCLPNGNFITVRENGGIFNLQHPIDVLSPTSRLSKHYPFIGRGEDTFSPEKIEEEEVPNNGRLKACLRVGVSFNNTGIVTRITNDYYIEGKLFRPSRELAPVDYDLLVSLRVDGNIIPVADEVPENGILPLRLISKYILVTEKVKLTSIHEWLYASQSEVVQHPFLVGIVNPLPYSNVRAASSSGTTFIDLPQSEVSAAAASSEATSIDLPQTDVSASSSGTAPLEQE